MTRPCSQQEDEAKRMKRHERYIDRLIAFADRAPADPLATAYLDDVSPMEAIQIATGVRHDR